MGMSDHGWASARDGETLDRKFVAELVCYKKSTSIMYRIFSASLSKHFKNFLMLRTVLLDHYQL